MLLDVAAIGSSLLEFGLPARVLETLAKREHQDQELRLLHARFYEASDVLAQFQFDFPGNRSYCLSMVEKIKLADDIYWRAVTACDDYASLDWKRGVKGIPGAAKWMVGFFASKLKVATDLLKEEIDNLRLHRWSLLQMPAGFANAHQALHHNPHDADVWLNLGVVGGATVGGTNYDEKSCFLKALHHNPQDAYAWLNLGLEGGGRVAGTTYDEKNCFLQALHHDPQHAPAWNCLGCMGGGTVSGTHYDEKSCYLQALQLNPKYSSAWKNLAVVGGGSVNGQYYTATQCREKAAEYRQ
jgi:tetratricopeptide (TPR) repeat protein